MCVQVYCASGAPVRAARAKGESESGKSAEREVRPEHARTAAERATRAKDESESSESAEREVRAREKGRREGDESEGREGARGGRFVRAEAVDEFAHGESDGRTRRPLRARRGR